MVSLIPHLITVGILALLRNTGHMSCTLGVLLVPLYVWASVFSLCVLLFSVALMKETGIK